MSASGGFAITKGYGVYVDEKNVYVAEAGLGLGGSTVTRRLIFPLGERPLSEILREVTGKKEAESAGEGPKSFLKKIRGFLRDLPIVIAGGVSETAVFYSAFPMANLPGPKTTADNIIMENPRAAFLGSTDLLVDVVGCSMGEKFFAQVGAAKKPAAQAMLQSFYDAGMDPIRIEPGPWAALRVAWRKAAPPSAKESEIRILVGADSMLAVLTQGSAPFSWQSIPIEPDTIEEKLPSILHRFSTLADWKQRIAPVKQIVIQGEKVPEEWVRTLSEKMNMPVKGVKGPVYDGHMIAHGVALGALNPDSEGLNLVRSLQRPVPLWCLFPRVQAVLSALMVALVLVSMHLQATELDAKVRKFKRENAQASWATGKKVEALEQANKRIYEEARPLSNFMGDRMPVAPLLEAATRHLPPNGWLAQIEVEDAVWIRASGGKDCGDRFAVLMLAAKFPEDGRMPEEVDRYLGDLRADPFFKKYLPKVQLSTINWRRESGVPVAFASILCAPATPKESEWKSKKGAEEK